MSNSFVLYAFARSIWLRKERIKTNLKFSAWNLLIRYIFLNIKLQNISKRHRNFQHVEENTQFLFCISILRKSKLLETNGKSRENRAVYASFSVIFGIHLFGTNKKIHRNKTIIAKNEWKTKMTEKNDHKKTAFWAIITIMNWYIACNRAVLSGTFCCILCVCIGHFSRVPRVCLRISAKAGH